MNDAPWLTITTFLPLVGVVVLFAVPNILPKVARGVALVTSVATFAAAIVVLANFDSSAAGFQLVEDATWVESLNFRYIVGVDGISLVMVLLTTFLLPLAIAASWKVEHRVRAYMAAMLLLETALIGVFVSLDLLLFFLFFEGMLFPMYLIIGGWGGERRVYAAIKFFLYTMAGSAFLFVGILFLYFRAGSELGQATFDVRELANMALPAVTGRWLFLAFFIAFAVKVPLFPLHTWLPDAHVEAPTAGSVILAGVLLKIGAYGLIRFNLSLFPEASVYFADLVSILALIGIVYGAVVALIQRDLKRLVAYSSVSHLGFVVIGIFAFSETGMAGGVLQMVNHGLSTGALFLLVGMVYERTHTRQLDEMGGMASVTPVLAGVFLFVALSSLGLPGLNNFVGEFLVILGTFTANHVYGVIAASAIVLAAIYLLWSYQRMMHGPVNPAHADHPDMSLREKLILAPIVVLIVALGVYPKLALDTIEPTTESIVRQVDAPSGALAGLGGAP
jgi:NADH-quinone oxidoreductase subunit M